MASYMGFIKANRVSPGDRIVTEKFNLEKEVKEKIELLYDFSILKKKGKKKDEKEEEIKKILLKSTSRFRLEADVREMTMEGMTAREFIKKYGG